MPRKVGQYGDLFTIDEWKKNVAQGLFNKYDGSGCFVQDDKYLTDQIFDDVFGPIPDAATHVEWYNK